MEGNSLFSTTAPNSLAAKLITSLTSSKAPITFVFTSFDAAVGPEDEGEDGGEEVSLCRRCLGEGGGLCRSNPLVVVVVVVVAA